MKINKKILLGLATVIFAVSSCEKLLEVESDQLVYPDEQQLNSPNSIIYPMLGILSQLEKLSESYVLLGELRGELMNITDYSRNDIVDIYNFDVAPDNQFNKIEDYYAVINNCNSLIHYTDTSVVYQAEKILYREFAAAKAIRAWTYWQIALNYGEAIYYEEPLLSVEEAKKEYPVYTLNDLAPVLIQDLIPYRSIESPENISLGEDISSMFSYIPVKMILGDLYLWSGQYEEAAREYHDLMEDDRPRLIYSMFRAKWNVENNIFIDIDDDWEDIFKFTIGYFERISQFAGSTEYGDGSLLDSLCYLNYEIVPSTVAKNNWDNQIYYHNNSTVKPGDLRGKNNSYYTQEYISGSNPFYDGVIAKFIEMTNETSKSNYIYRSGLLYLRYAEAINRAGKPNAAWLVLKSGMNEENMEPDSIVPAKEKYADINSRTYFDYMDFSEEYFEFNIGVHARGCGNTRLATSYAIPALATLEDSINYVEEKIIEELALETAFEGNRFHDLMRVALRRNDPSWLAKKVSQKYDDPAAMESKLMDQNNWYIRY